MWNAKFFNFYNNGNDVLITKKFWNTDQKDQSSFIFIVDNMNVAVLPTMVTFADRQTKHQCFDKSHSSFARSNAHQSIKPSSFLKALKYHEKKTNGKKATLARTTDEGSRVEQALEYITNIRTGWKNGKPVYGFPSHNRRREF
ncbi:Oidioi.mRNA.OKI2018_I69.PAR.g10921.t1.cds [Oikopleura dioica]|uniref:Oidioi.mRNA.OKI2018_I69.PAR.g10921.t1.cds n=1 Tax=Oikopleura dioica TaxID=34765 RepID=A0ABN7RY67_OIKDI|nr:Oidioi.mRNA.OKI2018_I69.PAR.g10921.t1.cds [Oikopleura dioica]